jgi:hypothetical protein
VDREELAIEGEPVELELLGAGDPELAEPVHLPQLWVHAARVVGDVCLLADDVCDPHVGIPAVVNELLHLVAVLGLAGLLPRVGKATRDPRVLEVELHHELLIRVGDVHEDQLPADPNLNLGTQPAGHALRLGHLEPGASARVESSPPPLSDEVPAPSPLFGPFLASSFKFESVN